MRAVWLRSALLLLLAAACGDAAPTPYPEATSSWQTSAAPLAPTATVNPVAPFYEGPAIRDPGLDAPGVSNPTLAGLAAEGQPDQRQPTLTPPATQAQLPMVISGPDGLILRATFYSPAQRPAPAALILRRSEFETWDALAAGLQAAGYAAIAVDLRGYGETGGAVDWPLALEDARAALNQVAALPGVAQVIVIGDGIGANLALNACADAAACAGVALLSPGLDYLGITTADAMARLGRRAALIIASENDDNNPSDSMTLDALAVGNHQLIILPGVGHGAALFAAEPGLQTQIIDWLRARIPPPGAAPTPEP